MTFRLRAGALAVLAIAVSATSPLDVVRADSPSLIVVTRSDDSAASLLAFSDGCSIVVTPLDGSRTTIAVAGEWSDPSVGYCFTDPAWSSDGRRLTFGGRNDALTDYSLWTLDFPAGDLRLIAAGLGSSVTRRTCRCGRSPCWRRAVDWPTASESLP